MDPIVGTAALCGLWRKRKLLRTLTRLLGYISYLEGGLFFADNLSFPFGWRRLVLLKTQLVWVFKFA